MKRRLWYWITDALGVLVLLGTTIFVLVRYPAIPAQVPTNFDAAGRILSYSGKSSLIGLLVTAWILFAVLLVRSFFPQRWKMRRRTPRAYQATADALAVTRLVFALLLGYLTLCSALCRGLGAWCLPVVLAVVLIPLVWMIVASLRG